MAHNKATIEERVRAYQDEFSVLLPPGAVIPMHSERGHFYKASSSGQTYGSVTEKLKCIKDESIQNFALNEGMRYIEANLSKVVGPSGINMIKAIDMFDAAKKASSGVLSDAGDIGNRIHDRRDNYFQNWIDTGTKPDMALFIFENDDPRLIAAMKGLEKFVVDYDYRPIRTELMLVSHKYKVGGTLDDVGLARFPGEKNHQLVLMDLKTSNQFKAHYWLQVALYHIMLREITGINTKRHFILKLSKETPTYKVEEITSMAKVAQGVRYLLKVDEAMNFIKETRSQINKKNLIVL